jgi:hypothetical protein
MDRKGAIRNEMANLARAAKTKSIIRVNLGRLERYRNAITIRATRRTVFAMSCFMVALLASAAVIYHNNHIVAQAPNPIRIQINQVSYTPEKQGLGIGQITSPITNSITGRNLKITGFTQNVPPDIATVLVAVDVPNIGLLWPKQIVAPNTAFQISIDEHGPNTTYKVSLYALGYGMADSTREWFKEQKFGGLPIWPDKYRLDSVVLNLNEA